MATTLMFSTIPHHLYDTRWHVATPFYQPLTSKGADIPPTCQPAHHFQGWQPPRIKGGNLPIQQEHKTNSSQLTAQRQRSTCLQGCVDPVLGTRTVPEPYHVYPDSTTYIAVTQPNDSWRTSSLARQQTAAVALQLTLHTSS